MNRNLYNCDHDDFMVVYMSKHPNSCPFCELKKEKELLEEQNYELDINLRDLETDKIELTERIAELERELNEKINA